ncbi:hypothetical protein [Burkholderia thailandensis]|uniref:hypothetical protein n=1 Tax=Burkholderia thailandensis TaxID=57975 RepID=UPI0022AC7F4A|nr:hypothetical protein [Burkholderia thailandensis]MCZ2903226.1 hypothetical protein [Burkholderia thailandensis]MDD1484057.1 hypothetical protein [Burkholderia thailandensis]MDD1489962.1 hypothetical protein [Burkholderia thailandensis]MDD1496308.1 hypothetical protein [Burkholderia thailandensis]
MTIERPEQNYAPVGTASATNMAPAVESLLSADGLFVTLPYGGPEAQIDLHRFAHALCQRGTTLTVLPIGKHGEPQKLLPIAKKTQKLDDFTGGPANGLDSILRRCFLPKGSPYQNTMQATNAVVDALVETSLFSRTVQAMSGFYRPVQCLAINERELSEFVERLGQPKDPIALERLIVA